MNYYGWMIFTLFMGIPGIAEFYAAIKLFPFIRREGGLIPFLFCVFSGLFDITFMLIMGVIIWFVGKGDANLTLDLPLDNLIVLAIVIFISILFVGWRILSAVISLWFGGLLSESLVRSVTLVKILESKKRKTGYKRKNKKSTRKKQ